MHRSRLTTVLSLLRDDEEVRRKLDLNVLLEIQHTGPGSRWPEHVSVIRGDCFGWYLVRVRPRDVRCVFAYGALFVLHENRSAHTQVIAQHFGISEKQARQLFNTRGYRDRSHEQPDDLVTRFEEFLAAN